MRIAAEASAATQSRSERRYRKSSPSFSRAKNARNASRDEWEQNEENARDGRGDAPAHVAFASGGNAETAFALLPNVFFSNTPNTPNTRGERDAFRGCGGWTCLHFAARGGHLELVDRLTRLESTDVAAADDAGLCATRRFGSDRIETRVRRVARCLDARSAG